MGDSYMEVVVVGFVGRQRELAVLDSELAKAGSGEPVPGRCLLVRGRRRVGKSRLVEEFLEHHEAPSLFFTASGAPTRDELAQFVVDAAESTLPNREVISVANPASWHDAFRLLAAALPDDRASVVVIDELPYLMDDDHALEGTLQRAWDRELSRKPVLLILVGSDLSMMRALNEYDRPFHQRGREMVVGPLNPADVAAMLDLDAAAAFDAALVTGGLPLVCADWAYGQDLWGFLGASLDDPTSPLLVSAERSLAAEFPGHLQPRTVLGAIGSGERTFAKIGNAAGGIAAASLQRSLDTLVAKQVVTRELPLSTARARTPRYRVTDPYLRFWLRFLGPAMPEIERGRGDRVLERIRIGWPSWRGRAVEPLVRDALARLLPDDVLPAAPAVGGYWTRGNDIEIDIVGADRAPVAHELLFVGSVKWLEHTPFDDRDHARMLRHRAALTDEPLPTVAVTRTATDCRGPDAVYAPNDLLRAW